MQNNTVSNASNLHSSSLRRSQHTSLTSDTEFKQTSPWGVIRHLSGFPYSDEGGANHDIDDDNDDDIHYNVTPLDDVWSVASKRRGVYNLIQVPHRLERLLFFIQAICIYDFLSVFTFLPLRFLISLLYFSSLIILYPFQIVFQRVHRFFNSLGFRKSNYLQVDMNQQPPEPLEKKFTEVSTKRKNNAKSKSKSKGKPPSPKKKKDPPRFTETSRTERSNSGRSSSRRTFKSKGQQFREYQSWTRRLISFAIDVQYLSLLAITVFVLSMLDTSRIYHGIRGQSVIKLYVVFNVIEIFDRLCSSFGVDMLDSLGWTTASAVSFISSRQYRRTAHQSPSSHAIQTFILLTRVLFDYIFALAYVVVHAGLLLTWVVTLNVCINTKNNALLTLLVSNNFVELKGHAFKSYKIPNIFQIACADGVERFQLTTFLALMMVESDGSKSVLKTWMIVYMCEIIVDWVKHAFMLKFNRISHRVYRQFGLVVSQGIIASFTTNTNTENSGFSEHQQSRQQQHHQSHILHGKYADVVRSVGGSAISKRIGFVSLPLAALVLRMIFSSIVRLPFIAGGIFWLILLALECVVGICVVGHAWRRANHGFDDGTEEERERDEYWVQKLMQVERYDLISKS